MGVFECMWGSTHAEAAAGRWEMELKGGEKRENGEWRLRINLDFKSYCWGFLWVFYFISFGVSGVFEDESLGVLRHARVMERAGMRLERRIIFEGYK